METFNLAYTFQAKEEAPNSTDEKQPVSFKNQNHAVLTLEKRLKTLKAKKTKAKATASDRALQDITHDGSKTSTSIDQALQKATAALAASQFPPLSIQLSLEEEPRVSSHLLTDPSKKAAP